MICNVLTVDTGRERVATGLFSPWVVGILGRDDVGAAVATRVLERPWGLFWVIVGILGAEGLTLTVSDTSCPRIAALSSLRAEFRGSMQLHCTIAAFS